MSALLDKLGNLDTSGDPDELFRALKYDVRDQPVTVIRSPHDFTKQTTGSAEGVSYLLDEREMLKGIKSISDDVRERVIHLDAPLDNGMSDPNIRHRDATIDIAQKGSDEIEHAIINGRKVIILRGAHDAADLVGILKATGGNVGFIIVDTHTDIHTPSTSTSKNPHGMWMSVVLGEGEGLGELMKGVPLPNPENIIYIGPSQLEPAEVKRLTDKKIKVFTGYNLNEEEIMQKIDEIQSRVPLCLDIDEDGLIKAAATMSGGLVPPELLKKVANRIGTNQKLKNMHQVLTVGISEFQKPSETNPQEQERAEEHAEVLMSVVHQALGAGYPEESTDTGSKKIRPRKRSSRSNLRSVMYGTTAAATVALASIGSFIAGKNTTSEIATQPSSGNELLEGDKGFAKDYSFQAGGMSGESTFLPIITPDWKTKPIVDAFTHDFDESARRYENAISLNDPSAAHIAEREMLTYFHAALLKTKENPLEREKITKHVGKILTPDRWLSFTQQAAIISADPRERQELQQWLKVWQI